MKKKLTSILVLCIISFTLTLPVSAAQTVSKGIQPRVQECGNCGKMSLNTVKLNSYEKEPIIRKCTHGRPYGTDQVYKIYITYQYKCAHCSYKSSTWDIATRACLKIHSRHLHPLICGIFLPNSVNVARYASFIWQKSPTNCRIHLSESNFQTRSSDSNDKVECHGYY